ncbi:DUF5994 family protein [Streptomyces sp. MI02-7b]|uniref:DUF5994 family protein n=1 Tax=Streptomyces sp. MI02-7b TaxID=462941 RepID=UPI0029ABF68A|nr:DUF5994 family protein [Streptomyces sp. MI02-7b]MDX3073466.1 DUF5994 family protein [Streptomyces sp. MI02-7b]
MTMLVERTPHHVAAGLSARLSLTPHTALPGQLDGAWWPRSRDLAVELPALCATLDSAWGRITNITVNPARWPLIPRKVPVTGHTVHVGWFSEQDPDKVILLSRSMGRWDLLVIPPETPPAAAARLMTAAALPGSVLTAGALMAAEAVTGSTRDVRGGEDDWETEGGACMSPFGPSAGPLPAGSGG